MRYTADAIARLERSIAISQKDEIGVVGVAAIIILEDQIGLAVSIDVADRDV